MLFDIVFIIFHKPLLKYSFSNLLNFSSQREPSFWLMGGKIATASGRPRLIAVMQQLNSIIILLLGLDVRSLLKFLLSESIDIMQKGIEQTPKERHTLERAVSWTACLAATFEMPTLSSSFKLSSLKTSIPLWTSAWRIKLVLHQEAHAELTAPTKVLSRTNFLPVAPFWIGAVIFRKL